MDKDTVSSERTYITREDDIKDEIFQKGLEYCWKHQFDNAIPYLQKAADMNYPPAYLRLVDIYETRNEELHKKYKELSIAHKDWFIEKAKSGNSVYQYYMATYINVIEKDVVEHAVWLERSATQNYAPAQSFLGRCYLFGQGVAQDNQKCLYWIQKSLEQGFVRSLMYLSYFYYEDPQLDWTKSFQYAMQASQHELVDAFIRLGWCYQHGKGTATDRQEAVKWYEKAASYGSAEAMAVLGNMYHATQDYSKALEYYFEAALELRDPRGYYGLARCFYLGHGLGKDMREYSNLMLKSAKGGCGSAIAHVATWCEEGTFGMKQDFESALWWLRKGGEANDLECYMRLAKYYEEGINVRQDTQTAFNLYKKAAKLSHSAQCTLGKWYYHGKFVKQDFEIAVEWFRKSADQRNELAQTYLGRCYEYGEGVPQDMKQAQEWYGNIKTSEKHLKRLLEVNSAQKCSKEEQENNKSS